MAGVTAAETMATDLLETEIRSRRAFGTLSRQVAESEALTFRDSFGRLAAIAGLYVYEDGEVEAWLAAGPMLGRCLLAVVRGMREALAAAADQAPGVTVTAYVEPGGVAGDRLAAMLGFADAGITESPIGPLKTWRRRL